MRNLPYKQHLSAQTAHLNEQDCCYSVDRPIMRDSHSFDWGSNPHSSILFLSQFLIIVHLLTTKKLENAATFLPAKINIPLSHCQDVFDGEEHYCPSPGCCERSE